MPRIFGTRKPLTSELRRAAIEFLVHDLSLLAWLDTHVERRKEYPLNQLFVSDPSIVPQVVDAARDFALAAREAARRYEALRSTLPVPLVQSYYKARRDAYAADVAWADADHKAWVTIAAGGTPPDHRPNSIRQRLKASRLFLKLEALLQLNEFEAHEVTEAARRYAAEVDQEPA